METIRLTTWIDAPVERCFKLALSVDFHLAAVNSVRERALNGVTTGLMSMGEPVKWQGNHFGLRWTHTSVVDMSRPYTYFRDVMVEGALLHYEHDHHFATMNDGTRMRDELRFAAPMGKLGRVAEKMVLRRHLMELLARRNAVLKRVAESDLWHKYLDGQPEPQSLARR
jgi:ligand-binding SRPBCC domain-containing protein